MPRDVRLCRLVPVPLPTGTFDPGEYVVQDRHGIVYSFKLTEPIGAAQMADILAQANPGAPRVAA